MHNLKASNIKIGVSTRVLMRILKRKLEFRIFFNYCLLVHATKHKAICHMLKSDVQIIDFNVILLFSKKSCMIMQIRYNWVFALDDYRSFEWNADQINANQTQNAYQAEQMQIMQKKYRSNQLK